MGLHKRLSYDLMALHPEVTGSCLLVAVKFPNGTTSKFIVDCGLFQEKEYTEMNQDFPFSGDEIDFVLVTHNHVDHIGRLPLLVKKGFRKCIFCSKDTKKLLPLALQDSAVVLDSMAKEAKTKPLYTETDVEQTTSKVVSCNFEETIEVCENIEVTFFKNGHLPGASLVLVRISYPGYNNIYLLFTGDYKKNNMFFEVPDLPQWVLDLPITIVIESTYGTTNSSDVRETFRDNVVKCISKAGTVIIPVFALGRAQEVLYTLKSMQESGDIGYDVPIFFDGKLAQRYTMLYLKREIEVKEEMIDFLPENLTWVYKQNRMGVLKDDYKKIIVTTSGSGSYGPARLYIPEYISRENALIQFSGYTPEGTLGYQLKSVEKGEKITTCGYIKTRRAEIEYATEFSGHAKGDELISFLQQFTNIQLVVINHGSTDVEQSFKEKVKEQVRTKDVAILSNDSIFRLDAYGMCKEIPKKFN